VSPRGLYARFSTLANLCPDSGVGQFAELARPQRVDQAALVSTMVRERGLERATAARDSAIAFGGKQTPRQTAVQALRDPRFFEKVCA
jgi:hypothetical protein